MIIKEEWNILLLGDDASLEIPDTLEKFRFHWIKLKDLDACRRSELSTIPDMILALDENPEHRGVALIVELHKKWDSIPIVLVIDSASLTFIQAIYESGGFGFIRRQDFQQDFFSVLMKQQHKLYEQNENNSLVQNLSSLTAHLQEKNLIFRTVIDLLSHDTKNSFYYISTIINQIKDKSLKGILENAVNDLNDCIYEAYGYLQEQKRISSAVSLVEGLRLGQKRTALKTHPRIKFSHSLKYLLFIEVSALFKNALVNIIENGLRFSPSESVVHVEILREDAFVVFKVCDSGPGIPPENRERVFKRDTTVSRDRIFDGTSKGLWITKNIIEKEMGWITIEDNPGGGTIINVKVPAFKIRDYKKSIEDLSGWFKVPPITVENKETTLRTFLSMQKLDARGDLDSVVYANLVQMLRDDAQIRNKKHYHQKLDDLQKLNPEGKTVLVIDDSIHVHYYLGTHLTNIGYRIVGFAKDGAAGVSYYKALRPDLVTMDSTMPIMSGTKAAIEILKLDSEARVLFVTGVGGHPRFIKNVEESLPERNYRIITKPFKKEQLEEALGQLLGNRQ